MRALRWSLAAVPAALVLGCAVGETVRDMVSVQRCIADRAGTDTVDLNIRGKRLGIALVNSPLDSLAEAARRPAARRVAGCVRENLHRWNVFDEVAVSFTRRAQAGPLKMSATDGPIVFRTADLGHPAAAATDSGAGRPPTGTR